MSTLKTTNLQNPSAANPAIVLAADGSATANLSSLNGGQLAGTRNRIINGDMRIDQRNAGASVTATSPANFSVDRWSLGYSQNGKFTIQQNAGSVTPPAGFKNYAGITSTSAYSVVAGDYFAFQQSFEGNNCDDLEWGTANAVTVTLSFWVRSSLTGTFGGSFRNYAANRSYPFTYTVNAANTWERKIISVPGDMSGTWGAGSAGWGNVFFGMGIGSTYSGTAGSWSGNNFLSATGATSVVGTNGATFYITGVQLEPGTVATPFERRSFGQELALCQRYYWQGYHSVYTEGSPTTNVMMVAYPVTMRGAPTANWTPTYTSGSPAFNVNSMGTVGARSTISVSAGPAAGEWAGTIFLSAEL